jgi:hypothetical protein
MEAVEVEEVAMATAEVGEVEVGAVDEEGVDLDLAAGG